MSTRSTMTRSSNDSRARSGMPRPCAAAAARRARAPRSHARGHPGHEARRADRSRRRSPPGGNRECRSRQSEAPSRRLPSPPAGSPHGGTRARTRRAPRGGRRPGHSARGTEPRVAAAALDVVTRQFVVLLRIAGPGDEHRAPARQLLDRSEELAVALLDHQPRNGAHHDLVVADAELPTDRAATFGREPARIEAGDVDPVAEQRRAVAPGRRDGGGPARGPRGSGRARRRRSAPRSPRARRRSPA